MKKKNGFTLAEVLITLGIIGVVAAMTLPTLLTSTQTAQFRAQFKKTLAVSAQAVVVNLARNDFDAGTTTSTAIAKGADGEPLASLGNIFSDNLQVLNKNGTATVGELWGITDGGSSTSIQKISLIPTTNYTFFLNDGSVISFPKACSANTAASPCKGIIDVNGKRKPNKIAQCDTMISKIGMSPEGNKTKMKVCGKVSKAYDVIPIKIYDQKIEPNSEAGRYILYKAGK